MSRSLIRSGAVEEIARVINSSPKASACYIRDDLIFPYLAGTTFSQQFLKAHTGWGDLRVLFANPPGFDPADHPPGSISRRREAREDHAAGMERQSRSLRTGNSSRKMSLGEFNLDEVLKQFLGQQRADALAAAWKGDRYASFEDTKTKEVPVVLLVALDNIE